MHLPTRISFTLKTRLLLAFFGGLFGGLVYGWLFAPGYMEQVFFLSDAFILDYLKNPVEGNRLFWYLLKGRGLALVFLWLLGSSFLGGLLLYLVLLWSGFSLGIYVSGAVVKQGLKGIWFCIAAGFPQGLFYVPAYGIVVFRAFWLRKSREQRREEKLRYGIVLLMAFLLLFLGVLTESYINPAILKKLLKIF